MPIDLSCIQNKDVDESDDPPSLGYSKFKGINDDIPDIQDKHPLIEDEPEDPEIKEFGVQRRRKILTLQMYLNEFATELIQYKDINLETLTNDELEELRKEMDFVISARGNIGISVDIFFQSLA